MFDYQHSDPEEDCPKESTFRQVFRYRFDSFMEKGGISIFLSLVLVFIGLFVTISILRGIILWLWPDVTAHHHGLDFWTNSYIVFLELTDPGNMVQDLKSSTWYKLLAVLAGLSGVIMLSALIAFITTALDQKLNELKRGRSKVLEEDHTLILGWNEQRIVEILRELIIANESEEDACVVILANKAKEDMDDVLKLMIPNGKTTRFVTRSGLVSSVANLDIVSVETCKSVIVLANCEDSDTQEMKATSDAKIIQTILAVTSAQNEERDLTIVAEIFNSTYREIVQSTFNEQVVTIDSSDILAKILVQTSRSVGLSVVYNEILSFDGCEMYFHHDKWGKINFQDLAFHFPDGVPMGIRKSNGEIMLNPPLDYQLAEDDDILIVADDDSTIEFVRKPVATPRDFSPVGGRMKQNIEKELILGWTPKAPIVLEQYADYVKDDSQIDIMLHNPEKHVLEEIEKLNKESDIQIQVIEKDRLNTNDLLSVEPFKYDNIIILAVGSEYADVKNIDSENIVTLLLLREIFKEHPEESSSTKLITEVLDSQNYTLMSCAGVKDVIISNRLISMMLAQISESRDIRRVYDDIFEEAGSEIYLKPANIYFDNFEDKYSFADMMRVAQNRQEVCIGVKIKAEETDMGKNCGVQLIPLKNTVYKLQPDDCLVVLAEDEL